MLCSRDSYFGVLDVLVFFLVVFSSMETGSSGFMEEWFLF